MTKKSAYDNILGRLSSKVERRLEEIFADYNFDLGDEFEIAICEILRDFLPERYGICRGHLINYDGKKSKGDDIIIYDKIIFPTLRHLKDGNYSRKENIPIEAAYAYIEAKHTLDENSFTKAVNQIKDAKSIVSRRLKMSIEQYDPYIPNANLTNSYSDNYPKFRNPFFTMIISRKCAFKNNDTKSSYFQKSFLKDQREILENKNSKFSPEVIVAGPNLVLGTSILEDRNIYQPTIFLPERKRNGFYLKEIKGEGYGYGLTKLFAALDWTRLHKIDWVRILNEKI